MPKFNFQYCQKIVVFSKDRQSVLLCKRNGEEELNGIFTFIGGKMEITDSSIVEGVKREKDEEVGEDCQIKLYSNFTFNVLYKKDNGRSMILPHYFAVFESGEIKLNEEYSEYKWVLLSELDDFEPKMENIEGMIKELLKLVPVIDESDYTVI